VIINPTEKQREISQMYVTLAGTRNKIVMIEAGANEVPMKSCWMPSKKDMRK